MSKRTVWDADADMLQKPLRPGPAPDVMPSDPELDQQLHLINGAPSSFDINVTDVWEDYTGQGVKVTFIDVGVRRTHDDIDDNYDAVTDYDYEAGDDEPNTVEASDNHGQAVIGILAAEANEIGGVGVAFDADVRMYRGLSYFQWSNQLLDAMGLGNGFGNMAGDDLESAHDIVSMSFGLGSLNGVLDTFNGSGLIRNAVAAAERVAEEGREGLGGVLVKSAGNARKTADDPAREEVVAELFDSSRTSIVVAATRQDGWVTDFSSPGAALLVAAPVDNLNNRSDVFTLSNGSDTLFQGSFGGTSAAQPMVAGIVALMLEANPNLGWRDVQEILAMSARHAGSDPGTLANTGAPVGGGFEQGTDAGISWFWNAAGTWNGGGMHFSNDYGFGIVDAKAAVRLAETWERQSTSANDLELTADLDGSIGRWSYSTGFTDWSASFGAIVVEHVELIVDFEADEMEDVEIFVESPLGTTVQLLNDTGAGQSLFSSWSFGANAFRGENGAGEWTVRIRDDDGGRDLASTDIVLKLWGRAEETGDLFVFTNEFSDWAGGAGGHGTAFDGGGGVDTLNAAAVDGDSTIDFASGSGVVDGVVLTDVSGIERVYTGDGADTVIAGNDALFANAGRGADSLRGGAGADDLQGGDGTDTVRGGAGDDALAGDAGDDRLEGGRGRDGLKGGAGADTLEGGSQNDWLEGGDDEDFLSGGWGKDYLSAGTGGDLAEGGFGDDTLIGGMGADTLRGEDGDDRLVGQSGADLLEGGAGADTLLGGNGADTLDGGAGADRLTGGEKADRFIFSLEYPAHADRITDFELGRDTLALGDAGYVAAVLETNALQLDWASGHALILLGVTDAAALESDIVLLF